jgi:hypothetical protein
MRTLVATLLALALMTLPPTLGGAQQPLLLARMVAAQPADGAFLPSAEEVNRTLASMGDVAESIPSESEGWDARSHFNVQSGSELWLAGSVLPSDDEARRFFHDEAELLVSNNESIRMTVLQADAALGADEARDFRVIFIRQESGERISSYRRLVRRGRAVALVEATGSPDADDRGVVDNDRALMVVRLYELVVGKMPAARP